MISIIAFSKRGMHTHLGAILSPTKQSSIRMINLGSGTLAGVNNHHWQVSLTCSSI
ncbi:uncharacterized protein BDW43DRAFT_235748 [Aspergillus alliaceus]|uniref:uncharacterized protein n=1 Tax=Petromyces alliaceus TaxID=209559 RepID=UPI0012A462AA|nr:uncharacterized protein BDW43DRAFT_235748 [Aspergillus alliaceus]KAB8227863.1 hypothetical protein BDW43DRAFT_235748 [Aspergillus alliaceus]